MTTAPAPSDSLIRKGLGRVHLNSHRIGEALEIYAGVLRDCPEDVEAQLMLGDCYLAGGDAATATHLYTRARSLDPHHPAIDRRLWLAQAERAQLPETRAEAVPTDPEAIARLLQRLTDRETPVAEAEVNRAAQMLEEMINSRQPALAVAERLNEIDALLPALLELNVRQARAGGRPDLAEALDLLLQNIRPQLTTQSVISSQSSVISSQTDDWRLATDDWRLTTDSTPRRPTIHLGWIGPPGNV
ncbi:MAG: hypothetical protein HY260_22865 [Chloroflexi bacterium]|nr:hypothetical protein [Chloroflexota bacterium]